MNFIFISVLDISWAKNEDFVRSLFLSWFISNLEIEKWHCSIGHFLILFLIGPNSAVFIWWDCWRPCGCLWMSSVPLQIFVTLPLYFCFMVETTCSISTCPPPPTRKKRAKKKKKKILFLFHSWIRDIIGSSWSEHLKVCFPDSFTCFAYITEYALSEYMKSMSLYP